MYSYMLLANLEENFMIQTVKGLNGEGYAPLYAQGNWLIMKKGDGDRNQEDEEKMASVMFSMMKRMRFDIPYCGDVSNLFNRNYDRLVRERFSGLRLNDRYIWDLRQFIARAKVNYRNND